MGRRIASTELDLKFGGSNIDLDSMAREAIQTFDLNRNPPLPAGFRDQVNADFMANKPKFIVGHSVFKNAGTEIALEGEMTFSGYKPDANFTVDIAGYDKIIESLKMAARSDSEAARYFPFVLAAQGFGKKLPDGRLEWIINAKADGSLVVNGSMLSPPIAQVQAQIRALEGVAQSADKRLAGQSSRSPPAYQCGRCRFPACHHLAVVMVFPYQKYETILLFRSNGDFP